MTPCERVKAVYNRETPDYVPFTIYETKVVGRQYERELRDLDICLLRRVCATKNVYAGDISYSSTFETIGGRSYENRVIGTPCGDLTSRYEITPVTMWTLERLFKDEDDYEKLEYLFSNEKVVSDIENVTQDWLEDQKNEDVITRAHIWIEPMQRLISDIMGAEAFCYEWMDNRDRVLRLIDILRKQNREVFDITAKSPFKIVNFGGNVVPEIVGRSGFRDYYMAEWAEAANALKPSGKMLGSHLDARNAPVMDLIAESRLDYIEAYDPAMSPPVYEATRIFGDKILSLHFPSAWQYHDEKQIVAETVDMIAQAADPTRLIIGITEDLPLDRYVPVVRGITKGIKEFGPLR